MLLITQEQKQIIRESIAGFRNLLETEFAQRLSRIPYYQHTREMLDLYKDLAALEEELAQKLPEVPGQQIEYHVDLSKEVLPTFKRVVMDHRRSKADSIEKLQQWTTHPELLSVFDEKLKPLDDLIGQPWFDETEARSRPRLVDYFAIEQIDADSEALLPRRYDEKFHILQSPDLFFADLNYHRTKCERRGCSLVVAYLDIDNFKAFNGKYHEVNIDRKLLPPFMRCIEAHIYQHGYAYRYGGDEYVLLCPNMSSPFTITFLEGLRRRIAALKYHDIAENTTVSIGFCEIDSDSFVTNRELLELANRAKNFAKDHGRNCIATYSGSRFREGELYVADPAGA